MREEASLGTKMNGRDSFNQSSFRKRSEDDVYQNEKIILSINWKDIFRIC